MGNRKLGGKIGLQIQFFRALKYIKRKHMSVMDNRRRHSGLFKEKREKEILGLEYLTE